MGRLQAHLIKEWKGCFSILHPLPKFLLSCGEFIQLRRNLNPAPQRLNGTLSNRVQALFHDFQWRCRLPVLERLQPFFTPSSWWFLSQCLGNFYLSTFRITNTHIFLLQFGRRTEWANSRKRKKLMKYSIIRIWRGLPKSVHAGNEYNA